MAALDTLVVTTALTTIRLDLGASIDELEWTVNAYNLGFAVLLMTAAGARRPLRPPADVRRRASGSSRSPRRPARWRRRIGCADRRPRRPGRRRGAGHDARVRARERAPSRPSAAGAALGIFFAAHRPRRGAAARSSAARSPRASPGSGSSGSTCRSALALVPLALARMPESFGPDAALDLRGLALVTGGVLGIVWGLVRGNLAGWGSLEVSGARGRARCCWWRSWPGSCARRSRCCRWASSAPAPSRRATRRSSSPSGRCSAAVFFLAQFMQTALGYGTARGRAAAAAVDRDAVLRRPGRRPRSSTGSASGRSWSPARCCRRSAWAGSR